MKPYCNPKTLCLLILFISSCKPRTTEHKDHEQNLLQDSNDASGDFFDPTQPLIYLITDPKDTSLAGVLYYTKETSSDTPMNLAYRHISSKKVNQNTTAREKKLDEGKTDQVAIKHLEGQKLKQEITDQRLKEELLQDPLTQTSSTKKKLEQIPEGYKTAIKASQALALGSVVAFFAIPVAIFVPGVPLVPVLIGVGSLFGSSVATRHGNNAIYKLVEDRKIRHLIRIESKERFFLIERLGKEDYAKLSDFKNLDRNTQLQKIRELLSQRNVPTDRLNQFIRIER